MEGSDDEDNLIRLTAKEHFICHLLLTKMATGEAKSKLLHAAWAMSNQKGNGQEQRYKVPSRIYEMLRTTHAKALSEAQTGKVGRNKGRPTSPEWREKLRQANLGKKRSKESVEKQRNTMTGRKRSEEERLAISKGKKGMPSPLKGTKKSPEVIARIRKGKKRYWAKKKLELL